MKAVIYARVSTEEQLESWSVPAQVRECESYCQQKGWQLGDIYREEGKSARSDSIEKKAPVSPASRRLPEALFRRRGRPFA